MIRFTKLHGLGNDFIMLQEPLPEGVDWNAVAPVLCHRRTGIGADGLLMVLPSQVADVRMRIINADGSEAEMCGNGIRCFCKYVFDRGLVEKTDFTVETLGGIMHPVVRPEDGVAKSICVEMGKPELDPAKVPVRSEGPCIEQKMTILGQEVTYTTLAIGGVPHTVVFVEDLDAVDVATLGQAMEHASVFPAKSNINFGQLVDDHTIRVRTWERGCGCTLACGTGSTATAVAGALTGRTGRKVTIELALGALEIEWAEDDRVFMTGPAAIAFEGTISLGED